MTRVLLYGRSLVMASLYASLKAVPGLVLQNTGAHIDRLPVTISTWKPDALIFELTGIDRIPSLALLRDYPGLLLIGVDTEVNEIFVLSGHSQQAFSSSDLVKVIKQEGDPSLPWLPKNG